MAEYDVVVIGAGIAGLGVSALLAGAGQKVLTLERAKAIGGRAYSFQQRGHTTNTGGPRAAAFVDAFGYFAGDTVSSRSLPGLECAADSAVICADTVLEQV